MTAKTIDNSAYANSGYTLSGDNSSLTITSMGVVGGTAGSPSVAAGAGIALPGVGDSVTNAGVVTGGFYSGAAITGQGYVANTGTITGGLAGEGRLGGYGVYLSQGDVTNTSGAIIGGAGGQSDITGGAGGTGIFLVLGTVSNSSGTISGGGGGKAGGDYGGSTGGAGGVGVALGVGAHLANYAAVSGGAGGEGQIHGGTGGAGVVAQDATINNSGSIAGGAGGAGLPFYQYHGLSYFGVGGSGGVGVLLQNGGALTNSGSIVGGSGGTTEGAEFYPGQRGDGVDLTAGGSIDNGSVSDGTAFIAGRIGVFASGAVAVTVTNFGKIAGSSGVGVSFASSADRLIAEAGSTITGQVVGGGGTLENAGGSETVSGLGVTATATGDVAMSFAGFGTYILDPGATWTLVGKNTLAAGQTLKTAGTLTLAGSLSNKGSVTGLAASPSSGQTGATGSTGVNLASGAILTSAGRISGGAGGADTSPTGAGGIGGTGVYLAGTARFTNTGTVSAGLGGTGSKHGVVGLGVELAGGGVVTNGSASVHTALIAGRVGVYAVAPGAATVVNYGTITGTGGTSVRFGSSDDRLVAEVGSIFKGKVAGGGGTLQVAGGSGTITGLGGAAALSGSDTIDFSGFGVYAFGPSDSWTLSGGNKLAAGQRVQNQGVLNLAGTMLNAGTINGGAGAAAASDGAAGGAGVFGLAVSSGTLTSTGKIVGGAGGAGFNGGTTASAGGNGRAGVSLTGGAVTNAAGATITGGQGGAAGSSGNGDGAAGGGGGGITASGAVSVTNAGQIVGGAGGKGGFLSGGGVGGAGGLGGAGVYLADGARLTNTGTVSGGAGGAGGSSGATQGASGFGVHVRTGTGASVVNGSASAKSATVKGSVGIYAASATTVTNFGTIQGTGGTSVQFKSAGGKLIAEAGSTFIGKAVGGGGTLELADGTGTIAGLGGAATLSGAEAMSFSGFSQVAIDAGATWTLSGSNVRSAPQSLTSAGNLTIDGSLGGAGSLVLTAGTATFAAGAKLTIGKVEQKAGAVAIDTSLGFAGAWTQTTGSISIAAGDVLTLRGSANAFVGKFTGAGKLAIAGGATAFNAGSALAIAQIAQSGASSVTIGGNVTASGTWVQTAGTLSVSLGETLTLTSVGNIFQGELAGAGVVALDGGSDRIVGAKLAGQVAINGATVTLAGTITNSGTVTATTSHLVVGAAGATLAGGGAIAMTDATANRIAGPTAAATLTNLDNLIEGGGQLGGGVMALINAAAGRVTGDTAAALVINTGVNTIVNAGTITAAAGGGVEIKSEIANNGELIAAGGTLTLDEAVSGAGSAHISAGTLFAASAFSQNVLFTGTTGVFELAQSQAYAGSVIGFSHTGATSLDLRDINFVSADEASFAGTTSGGTLTVTDGAHIARIKLVGNYLGATFTASADGHGGTSITDANTSAAVHAFVAAMAGVGNPAGSSFTTAPVAHQPPMLLAPPGA